MRHLGVCAPPWLVMLTTQEFANLFEHMVSTTLICVSHLRRLILSSWHILSCLMEDNPYLVDTCLVVALSWCWLLDILYISQRPLYIGTPSVLWLIDHTLSLVYCACVWVLSSWVNFPLDKFLHGIKVRRLSHHIVIRPPASSPQLESRDM